MSIHKWRLPRTLLAVICAWLALLILPAATLRAAQPRPVRVHDLLSETDPAGALVPQPVPQAGRPMVDAQFGTRLVRVTAQPGLRHEYARFDPLNKDHSMILLLVPSSGEFRVYRTNAMPYDTPQNLVRTLDVEEPRWDSQDPSLIWGLSGFRVVRIHLATGKTSVVKDFAEDPTVGPLVKAEPDLYHVTTKGEGEASLDFRYWALALQGQRDDYRLRYLFCWDAREDRILGLCQLRPEERGVDWVGMSPRGDWVIVASDHDNGGRLAGVQLADRTLNRFHRIDYGVAHGDVGLDVHGNEVLVMQNTRTDFVDLIPLKETTLPILEAGGNYENSGRTRLVRLHYASDSPTAFQSAIHISCNAPGWCVISTFTEPGAQQKNWLDRTIVLVRLDPAQPEAYYLAKLHNTTGTYWEETQASITRDGSKVLWASNWGQDVGRERCFLMQLEVPKALLPRYY